MSAQKPRSKGSPRSNSAEKKATKKKKAQARRRKSAPKKRSPSKRTALPRASSSAAALLSPTVVRPAPATIVRTASEVQARMLAARAAGATIGFVPTMGALHDGHAALLDEARRRADIVVASIFVNPAQFGDPKDFAAYPHTLDSDAALCARCGVDYIFAPEPLEIYPPGFDTKVVAGALGNDLEGRDRPGHFDGVLTVVSVLLSIVQPHFAVFGEKDYQQLLLVRRLVKDLRLPIEIVPMPVIRDVDLVALSSRNARLSPAARDQAQALSRAIVAAQDALQRGETSAVVLIAAARAALMARGVEAHYVEVRDARRFLPVLHVEREARVLIAATVGGVRLIDNGPLFPGVTWRG
jgi:pantoate--beta-alanine ligase